MKVNKDVYEYIAVLADKLTTLNMLSVNKKFLNDEYYRRIIEKKYPYLMKLKDTEVKYKASKCEEIIFQYYMNWRQFYIKNIYYMLQLERKYQIPYFKHYYCPEKMWVHLLKKKEPYSRIMTHALGKGNSFIVHLMLEKKLSGEPKIFWLHSVCRSNNFLLFKEIYELVKHLNPDLILPLQVSYKKGNIEMMRFLIEKGIRKKILNKIFTKKVTTNHSALKFIIEKGANDFQKAISFYKRTLESSREYIIIKEKYIKNEEKDNVIKCIKFLEEQVEYLQSLCKNNN